MKFLFHKFFFAIVVLTVFQVRAQEALLTNAPQDFGQRIQFFSQSLLGKTYVLNPLGEGNADVIDQDPLFRLDAFDCMTYLESVIALSLSHNLSEINVQMHKLRYGAKEISFANRFHFVEKGWLANGHSLGLFQDATASLFPGLAETKSARIDGPSWFHYLNLQKVGTSKASLKARERAVQDLARKAKAEKAQISFLPKAKILENPQLLSKIPDGSMVFFVIDPSERIRRSAGTDLLIAHSGFVFQRDGKTLLRDASSRQNIQKVVEEDLLAFIKSDSRIPTLDGINIQVFETSLKFNP